jgi:hypothetical protein
LPTPQLAALEAAIRSGCVRVRLPTKASRPAKARQEPRTSIGTVPGRKMDPEKVREFRRRRAAGEDVKVLAESYSISLLLARNIDKGLRWGNVV